MILPQALQGFLAHFANLDFHERLALTIISVGLSVIHTPFFRHNVSRQVRAHRPAVVWALVVVSAMTLCFQLATIIAWGEANLFHSKTAFALSIFELIATASVTMLFNSSYVFSFPPLVFPSLFLAATLPYDFSMTHHCLKHESGLIMALEILFIGSKVALVVLGFFSHQGVSLGPTSLPNQREFIPWSSFISIPGLRSNFIDSELPPLSWSAGSLDNLQNFHQHWNQVDKTSNQALLKALYLTLRPDLSLTIPWRAAYSFFTLSQPFLFRRLLHTTFTGHFSFSTQVLNMVAIATVFSGISITKFRYKTLDAQITTSARGIVVSAIYTKMLRLRTEDIDQSFLHTAIAQYLTDVEHLLQSAQDRIWAAAQIVAGALLLLCIAGIYSLFITVPISLVATATAIVTVFESKRRTAYQSKKDIRAKLAANCLSQIQIIKMMGLEPVITEYLQQAHSTETDALLGEQFLRTAVRCLAALSHGMTPASLLGGLVWWAKSLSMFTAVEIFVYISMASIIANAASHSIDEMSTVKAGMQTLQCIQAYLLKHELVDWRERALDSLEIAGPRLVPSSQSHLRFAGLSVYCADGYPAAENFHLQMTDDCVTAVLAPFGRGKSTLARALLGEYQAAAGAAILAYERIAYCATVPWIRKRSIRANIVDGEPFRREWYLNVILACRLDTDLRELSDYDETIIDCDDTNISNACKQKIALARAAYCCAPVMVVDDALANLNYRPAQEIFRNLFGTNGLVRSWPCTVFMTTSIVKYLRFANGRFSADDQGQFEDLQNSQSIMSELSTTGDEDNFRVPYRNVHVCEDEELRSLQLQNGHCAEQNNFSNQALSYSLYAYFQESAGLNCLMLFMLSATLAAVLAKSPDIFLSYTLHGDHLCVNDFQVYVALVLSSIACDIISTLLYLKHISQKSSSVLHLRLVKTLFSATSRFLRGADKRALLKMLNVDISGVSRDLSVAFMQLCFFAITGLVSILIIASAARYSVLLAPLYFIFLYCAQKEYAPFSQRLRLLETQGLAAISSQSVETADGIEHIRALQRRTEFMEEFHSILDQAQRPYYYRREARARLELIVRLFVGFIAVALGLAAHVFYSSSSPTSLGLAFVTLVSFSDETTFLVELWTRLHDLLGGLSRACGFCADTPVEQETELSCSIPPLWPHFGRIEFFNTTTAPGVPESEGSLITSHNLESVSFVIDGQEKVALCASEGHGQSALVSAVLHMEAYSGRIMIDGRELSTIPRQALRSLITTITRDGIELRGSVRMNLDPLSIKERYFSDLDFANMLDRVYLWSTVMDRGGLNADISAMRFTPAEKQQFGLARAALHRRRVGTKIVLINKATNSMDEELETEMQDFMDGEFATCTVVTVADSKRPMMTADRYFIMQAGRLSRVMGEDDVGTPDDEE